MATSYQKLAELIINDHYGSFPLPEAPITQRFVAERIATKVAKYATVSAYKNSNGGDTTYANDQFISVFYNQTLLTNPNTNEKYIVMPATPAGLPKNTEIPQVSFSGYPNVHVIPCLQKDTFFESLYTPMPAFIVLYKIENGNIVFINLSPLITAGVNVKMIGAISGPDLLSSVLNIPKDVENDIFLEIKQELAIEYKVQPQLIESGEPEA